MFGRDKLRDELWEARIADLKREHDRTVDALTAWIEQLQGQLGASFAAAARPPDTYPAPLAQTLYGSEEEEALAEALEMGLISKDDYETQRAIQQQASAEI